MTPNKKDNSKNAKNYSSASQKNQPQTADKGYTPCAMVQQPFEIKNLSGDSVTISLALKSHNLPINQLKIHHMSSNNTVKTNSTNNDVSVKNNDQSKHDSLLKNNGSTKSNVSTIEDGKDKKKSTIGNVIKETDDAEYNSDDYLEGDDNDDDDDDSSDRSVDSNDFECDCQGYDKLTYQTLSDWVMHDNVDKKAVVDAIKIMNKMGCRLGPDKVTELMSKTESPKVVDNAMSHHFYCGLENSLKIQLKMMSNPKLCTDLLINLHIDRIVSSKVELWPILAQIHDPRFKEPFFIDAFYGRSKPTSVNKYFERFIDEYNNLRKNGFIFSNTKYTVSVRAFICRSAIKPYLTQIKAHNKYYGCGKCVLKGIQRDGKILFLKENAPLRTDKNFAAQEYSEHHSGKSPLESISLKMVSQIPLDYIDLVCNGVMKKLLKLWIGENERDSNHHLNRSDRDQLTHTTHRFYNWIPIEFNLSSRRKEEINNIEEWEPRDFYIFLLYLGPAILAKFLPRQKLSHFYALHYAITLLRHPEYSVSKKDEAQNVLLSFVGDFKSIYNTYNMTYSIHNLIHLKTDVENMGPLDTFSSLNFEDYKKFLKNSMKDDDPSMISLKSSISARIESKQKYCDWKSKKPQLLTSTRKFLPQGCTDAHESVLFENFKLSCKSEADNCCYLKDGTIVRIMYIGYQNKITVIIGNTFREISSLRSYYCDSQTMQIHVVRGLSLEKVFPISDISCKAFRVPFGVAQFVVFPMIF